MPSFFLAFIAALLTSIGSRDQLLVTQLSVRLGRNVSLLLIGWLTVMITAAVMAWAGQTVAQILPPEGKTMLVAFALLLAAGELAWPTFRRPVMEPTRSLVAIAVVLFSRQLGDGTRFLVFAIAAATGAPVLAGIGGGLGGALAVTVGWFGGEWLTRQMSEGKFSLRLIRLLLAGAVVLTAAVIGLNARGLLS